MAKTTVHGGVSDVSSVITHPKRHSVEEVTEEVSLESTQEDETDDYTQWTVTELRDELAGRELPTSGKKDELIARLQENDAELDEDDVDDDTE